VLSIGSVELRNSIVLAPMAGITDLPFRELAFELGAGMVVAEMTNAAPHLFDSALSVERRRHSPSIHPRAVQIAGGNPDFIAAAARAEADAGAELIDINMGCPAKKVCQQAAGSSLLRDEGLVARILRATVRAVTVPVTVKIRTGWSPAERNGVAIAKIAESEGVCAIAVHGRTRACRFEGAVEYETIAEIKAAVSIPVFANGDIASVAVARDVLRQTRADGLLIGRAALGAPWLPGDLARALERGSDLPVRSRADVLATLRSHLARMHDFYSASTHDASGGEHRAVRIARKHLKAYLERLGVSRLQIAELNAIETAAGQRAFVERLAIDTCERAAA